MRTVRESRTGEDRSAKSSDKNTPIVIMPTQSGEAIRRRREIRDTFHDSKAVTIRRKKHQ
jgi:hypothetical protein